MTSIQFDKRDTWNDLVEYALENPNKYLERMKKAGLEYAFWDCSGLDHIFSDQELNRILSRIEHGLGGKTIQLYHGCRLSEDETPAETGIKISNTEGIVNSLIDLAENDPVLSNHVESIKEIIQDPFYQRQFKHRNGQIWFCLTESEMIHQGGVYPAFGSEFRLLILNGIDDQLKHRLFYYGKPSIVVMDLPIEPYLSVFKDSICKFIFSLWTHHCLVLPEQEMPTGFSCYIKTDIPPEYIIEIVHPKGVFDQYNKNSRWYKWNEMVLG